MFLFRLSVNFVGKDIIMSDHGQDEGIAEILAMLNVHIGALRGIQDRINDNEAFERMAVGGLNVRMTALKDHFRIITQSHVLYRQANANADDVEYREVQDDYLSALDKIQTRIDELTQVLPEHGQLAATSTMFNAADTVFRLEPPRRPHVVKFNGSPEDWIGFRDIFMSEVHNRDFDPIMKFVYLREACTGKAARTLGTWQVSAQNYQAAWDSLLHAYNDDYQVVHGILESMDDIKVTDGQSNEDIQEVLTTMNNSIRMLCSVTTSQQREDQMWIHWAKAHLAASVLDEWEQYRNREKVGGLPTLEEFKQFLHYKSRVHKGRRGTSELTAKSGAASDRIDLDDPSENESDDLSESHEPSDCDSDDTEESYRLDSASACIMDGCQRTHHLERCQEFEKLTLADKFRMVKRHQLCRCCLTTGHIAVECNRRSCRNCPDGRHKHHFCLCMKSNGDNRFTTEPAP